MRKFDSIDDYIAQLPLTAQETANALRHIVKGAAPHAIEAIRYNMPAFKTSETSYLYFACWKKHAGLYPIYKGDPGFEADVGQYRAKKDTLQFFYRDALPADLLGRIVRTQIARSS